MLRAFRKGFATISLEI
jgi:hypothetical protein